MGQDHSPHPGGFSPPLQSIAIIHPPPTHTLRPAPPSPPCSLRPWDGLPPSWAPPCPSGRSLSPPLDHTLWLSSTWFQLHTWIPVAPGVHIPDLPGDP